MKISRRMGPASFRKIDLTISIESEKELEFWKQLTGMKHSTLSKLVDSHSPDDKLAEAKRFTEILHYLI